MEFRPYPKMLYKNPGTAGQKTLVVPDETTEQAARLEGWGGYLPKVSLQDSDSNARKSGISDREEITDRLQAEICMADVEPEADPEPKPRKRSRKEAK